eukprot:scaffold10743_cov58-Attheya_sp.AAC.2
MPSTEACMGRATENHQPISSRVFDAGVIWVGGGAILVELAIWRPPMSMPLGNLAPPWSRAYCVSACS